LENSISVLLGHGNGTFDSPIKYATDNNPSCVISSDFNNDDKLDLAVANKYSNDLTIFLNQCK
jgi:hypothetical protein